MEIIACFMFKGKCIIVMLNGDMYEIDISFDKQPIIRFLGLSGLRNS